MPFENSALQLYSKTNYYDTIHENTMERIRNHVLTPEQWKIEIWKFLECDICNVLRIEVLLDKYCKPEHIEEMTRFAKSMAFLIRFRRDEKDGN